MATKLGRTRNLRANPPTWTDITPSTPTITNRYDFILDSWNPSQIYYLSSDVGVHRSTNAHLEPGTGMTWSLVISKSEIETLMGGGTAVYDQGYKLLSSINKEQFIALFCRNQADTSTWCLRSTDRGDNWSASQVSTNGNFWGGADYHKKLVGGHVVMFCATNSGNTAVIRTSTDSGATWSTAFSHSGLSTFDSWRALSLHIPYHDNPTAQVLYWAFADVSGAQHFIRSFYTTNGGSTVNTIQAAGLSMPAPRRELIETQTLNRSKVSYWDCSTSTPVLKVSVDGGATFSTQATTGISGRILAASNFVYNGNIHYAVTTDGLFLSTDGGATWRDVTGNYETAVESLPSAGVVPSGHIFAVDWTSSGS